MDRLTFCLSHSVVLIIDVINQAICLFIPSTVRNIRECSNVILASYAGLIRVGEERRVNLCPDMAQPKAQAPTRLQSHHTIIYGRLSELFTRAVRSSDTLYKPWHDLFKVSASGGLHEARRRQLRLSGHARVDAAYVRPPSAFGLQEQDACSPGGC